MNQRLTSRLFDVIFLLLLTVLLVVVARQRQAISDWWFFRQYQPDAAIAKLADDAGLNQAGRRLFYRTNPQLVDQADIGQYCDLENLGCITERGQVYILNDSSRYDDMVVTAAHEMLHLAYLRLSDDERWQVNAWLQAEQLRLNDARLEQKLAPIADPVERLDELHSYVGTEQSNLSAQLEAYYGRYFAQRSRVWTAYGRSRG